MIQSDLMEELIRGSHRAQIAFRERNGLTDPGDPGGVEELKKWKKYLYALNAKRGHPSFYEKSQQTNETINPLLQSQVSNRLFCDLPGELIHIILYYYTHSFKDLIKFSTINKTCKQIADYSLLWLQVNLMFYPPYEYLDLQGYGVIVLIVFSFPTYEAFIEAQISRGSFALLQKQLFSTETKFPVVYKVQVAPFLQDLAQYKNNSEESDNEIAYRVGQWWKDLFVQYQRLYDKHVKYVPYLNYLYEQTRKIININPNLEYILFFTVVVGIVSIYLLFDCNNTNLSLKNKIGLYLLFGIIGFYLILNLIYMLNSFAKGMASDSETLLLRFKYSYLSGYDRMFLAFISLFISLILALLKCDGSFGNSVDWWVTVLPLWIGGSLVYGLWYYDNRIMNRWNLFGQFLAAYGVFSPPLTFTLVACYYDHIYPGPFQYTLFPLYPIFLLAIVASGIRAYLIGNIIYDLIKGRNIVPVFSSYKLLNNLSYFFVVNMTTISIVISSWSVIMLLIDSYRIDDNDWDKRFFSVHFTPLTCFLIFLFSCLCIYLGVFIEKKYLE